MAATTFLEKKNLAYVVEANAIAQESVGTANHAQRLVIAKQMAQGGGSIDWYVTINCNAAGYTDATPQQSFNDQLQTLVPVMVTLGFGG